MKKVLHLMCLNFMIVGSLNHAHARVNNAQSAIITDYLGTPMEMYDSKGERTWAVEYDIYGKVRKQVKGKVDDCPFRYQGQYEDVETGLYYNRFRYYDCSTGTYISQDPIGLEGGMPNLYSYVHNSNSWVDPFGLMANFLTNVDFTGSPDLFPTTGSQKNIVTIKLTGRRSSDFTASFKEAGIDRKLARDYTWHHVADFNPDTGESTMQLVKRTTHEATYPHKGSAGQFADHFGVKYDTSDAVDASKKKGWHPSCN